MSLPRSTLRRLALLAGAFLLLGTLLVPSAAPAATPCEDPPAIISQARLTPGVTGDGLTTLDGTEPVPFEFEVVGTIPDGWMLGLDAIVIRITGPESFLDATGGVFFGMSGSPVYVNGKLAGAVSAVFWEDPTFGVLTPAKPMLEVLEAAQGAPLRLARTIRPTDAIRREIAAAEGVSPSEVQGTFRALPTPLGVAGLPPAKVAELQARLDERGENVFVYRAAAARISASAVTPTQFAPGEPLGAAISYGDASLYATGTATAACGDYVVAFGHPFFWDAPGEVSLGLAGAEGLMVVTTKEWGGPGYRFGLLTEPRGTVVQDRFAGIAGVVGQEPRATLIRSHLMSRDTGNRRHGTTEALHTWGWWLEYIVWAHLWLNYSAALGHYPGEGTADLVWTISGTTEDGEPFTVSNRSMAYSEWDATEVVWRLTNAVNALQFNRFEDVTFTEIATHGTISGDELVGRIRRLRVASTSQPALRERSTLIARPGDRVTVEVTLAMAEGGTAVVTASFRVPRGWLGPQDLVVRGGEERYRYRARSLDQLIARLNGGEHPDDLVLEGLGRTRLRPQDFIVRGQEGFTILVVR